MRNIYSYIKSAFILVLILGAGALYNLANAQVTNGGFESGTTGWTGTGFSTSTGETVLNWNVQPADTKMGRVSPGSGSVTASSAQSTLGLSTQLTSISNITNVGYVYQDITMTSGQTITVYWNYVSQDYEPWDDGTFASFTKSGDVQFKILARTFGSSSVGVSPTGAYGSTGWHTVSFTAASAGTYRLGFGAFNWSDQAVHPILYIDNASGGTSSPQQPIVSTTTPSSITNSSGVVGGSVTSAGSGSVTDRGVVYSSSNSTPTIGGSGVTKVQVGTGLGTYSTTLSGLNNGTTYYVRAYATSSGGTSYGGVKQLTTLSKSPPTVSTGSVTNVDNNSATGRVNVSADGGATITQYGIVYGTSSNPTTSSSKAYTSDAPSLNTTYTYSMALSANTTYYVKGYAINSAGTSYGSQVSFKTASAPPVATAATLVGESSFRMNWNASTGAIKYYLDVSATSNFSSYVTGYQNKDVGNVTNYKITGLTPGTTYYYRLRAYNGDAISENSNNISVTTKILNNFLVEAYGGGNIGTQTAGQPFNIRITARDASNNQIIDYVGTAVITSNGNLSDGSQGISSFTTSAFTGGVLTSQSIILTLTGSDKTITATNGAKSGTSDVFTVMPGPIHDFTIVANPDVDGNQQAVMAGVAFDVLVKVYDEFGNLKTDFDGANSVTWTTTATPSRKGNVYEIPDDGNQTFDQGIATISGFTLYDAEETPTITITDGPTSSPGTTPAIEVLPNVLNSFLVEEYPTQTHTIGGVREYATVPFGVKVTARDQYNNIKRDYTGRISFKSSNDDIVQMPETLQQFVAGNAGVKVFADAITIPTIGTYWLRVGDSPEAYKTGDLQNIVVAPYTQDANSSELAFTSYPTDLTYPVNTVVAGDYVNITITPRDGGDNLLCDCQNIEIFLNGVSGHRTGNPENGIPALETIPYVDNHDGTYTASVLVSDMSQTNTIAASVNGTTLSTTLRVDIATPDVPSLIVSTITPAANSITTDENTVVTLQLKDQYGNNRLTDDGTITFTTTEGGFETNNGDATDYVATYAGNGAYTATLYASYDASTYGVGTATITAAADFTDVNHTDGTFDPVVVPTVSITEGLPDLTTSTITAADEQISTDETSVITVQLKDHLGNLIQNDRGAVTIYTTLGTLGSSAGSQSLEAIYASAGDYTVTLYGTQDLPVDGVGTADLTAQFVGDGSASDVSGYLNDGADYTVEQVQIGEGLPDVTTIDISVADTEITADDSTTVTVQLKDQFGNLITHDRGTVTLSVNPIGVIDNGTTQGAAAIVATYDDAGDSGTYVATFKLAEEGIGLATITGKINIDNAQEVASSIIDNATVNVLPGVATQLAVETQPAHTTTEAIAGVEFSTQPQVSVKDQWGNIVTADDTTTITAATGSTGTDNLLGTLSATAVDGIASFAGLKYETAEDMNIEFTSGSLIAVTSGTLTVVHNVPDYLVITGDGTQTAGVAQTITVKAYDVYGNLATRFEGPKSLTFSGANNSPAPAYTPTVADIDFGSATSLTFTGGVASASMVLYKEEAAYIEANHTDDFVDASYTGTTAINIDAETDGETIDNGLSVTVSQAEAAYFAITGTATQTAGVSQAITVTAYDAFNNIATNYAGTSLTFSGASVTNGSPTVNPTVDAINFGAATRVTFADGKVTLPMVLYKDETINIDVTDGNIGSGFTHNSTLYDYGLDVNVDNETAAYLALDNGVGTNWTGSEITAGANVSVGITAYDQYNNVALDYDGAKSLTFADSGDPTNQPFYFVTPEMDDTQFGTSTSISFTEGVASATMNLFTVRTDNITVTDASITSDITIGDTNYDHSLDAIVNHAAADRLSVRLESASSPLIAGDANNVVVTAYDAYNNVATSYTGTTIRFSGAGSSVLPVTAPTVEGVAFGSDTPLSFSNGVATSSMVLYKAETGISIAAADWTGGSEGIKSELITFDASDYEYRLALNVDHHEATKLVIDTEPSAYVRAGDALAVQPVISIRDAYGNITTSDNSTVITATRNAGTATESLQGDVDIAVVGGVASFTDLSYQLMETIKIDFDAASLPTVTSNEITVDHNATAYYTYTATPDYIYSGGQRGAFTVKRYDAYDNVVNNLVLSNGDDSTNPETVYLYSNLADASNAFYNVATGGSAVTSVDIANGNTTTDFWFYTQKEGTHTISASDNSTAADGDTGIDDATYQLEVKPAALDHFVVSGAGILDEDPESPTYGYYVSYYGDPQTITVEAIDIFGNRKINYEGTITFTVTDDEAVEGTDYPADYTFTVGEGMDNGIHEFTDALILKPSYKHPSYPSVEEWWVTVVDQAQPSKYGAQTAMYVKKRPILVTANPQTKIYGDAADLGNIEFTVTNNFETIDPVYWNANKDAGINTYAWSEYVTASTFTSNEGEPASAEVGSYDIVPEILEGANGFDIANYDVSYANGALTVNKRPITITVDAEQEKVYSNDNSTDPVFTFSTVYTGDATLDSLVNGDAFTGALTRETGEDVGFYDILFSGLGISDGTDKVANYDITYVLDSLEITRYPLTLSNFVVDDKVYDATDTAYISAFATDIISGDELSFDTTANFVSRHVNWYDGVANDTAVAYEITISGGADADNYEFATDGDNEGSVSVWMDSTLATISQYAIDVTAVTDTKAYDGTTTSDETPVVDALLGSDVVSNSGLQVFDTENQGTDKTLTPSGTVISDGNSGDNYAITYVADNTGEITKRELTGSFTADNKVYNGTTDATVLTRSLSNVVSGEEALVALTGGTAAFDNKHVGTGKTVTLTGATITGTGVDNYTLGSVNTTTADVSVREINVTAVADTKIYDGTTTSDEIPVVDALQTGDVVTSAGSQTYDDKNVGIDKTVTPAATVINDGNSGANYAITYVDNTASVITTLDITGTFTADNKVYDGDADATVLDQSLVGVLSDDQAEVSLTGGSASFSDRHVGNGKTVTASGMTLAGVEAGNYNLTSVATTTANITPLAITGNFTVEASKEYDGDTEATVIDRTLNNIQNVDDDVSLTGGTANYDDKNVGITKTVTLTEYSLTGAQSGNYTLSSVATTTADITTRTLHLSNFAADNKVYDGTTVATGLGFADDRVPGDNLSFQRDADFEDAAVGADKVVIYNSVSITGGADIDNYVVESETSHWKTAANRVISAFPITVTIVAGNKEYDETADATVTLSGNFVEGDDVSLTYTSAVFDDATVGTGKTVTVTGIALAGADAGLYTLASTSGTTSADITRVSTTVTVTGDASYTYNGLAQGPASVNVSNASTGAVTYSYSGTDNNSGNYGPSPTAPTNAGTYQVVATVAADGTYQSATSQAYVFTINRADAIITVTPYSVDYDGTQHISTFTAEGVEATPADLSSLMDVSGTAHTNAGTYTSDTWSFAGNANYNATNGTVDNSIAKLALTVTAHNDSKAYDGLAYNGGNGVTYSGFNTGENESDLAGTLSYSGTSQGAIDKGDYVITPGGLTSANYEITFADGTLIIGNAVLTITAKDDSKTYDGQAYTGGNGVTYSGFVDGDDESTLTGTLSYSGTSQNTSVAGTYVITPGGVTSNNYTIQYESGTLTIGQKDLTIVSAAAESKVYDGNNQAVISGAALSGVVSGDEVTLINGISGTFAQSTIGTGISISTDMTLGGTDAGNYNLLQPSGLNADITVKTVTIGGTFTVGDKAFDGTTAATITDNALTLIGKIGSDNISLNAVANFNDADYGINKPVNLLQSILVGDDVANYELSFVDVPTTTASISNKLVTINGSFTALNKIYDGTSEASINNVSLQLVGVETGHSVTLTVIASFNDKAVGAGKTVSLLGSSLVGVDAGNYTLSLNGAPTAIADITAKAVSVTGALAQDKPYDGTTGADVTGAVLVDTISGDDVVLTNADTGTFASAEVGTDISVSTNMQLSGADADNYSLLQPQGLLADIIASAQTLNFTAGWNMMSFGLVPTGSGKLIDVLKPLIDAGTLEKVIDEKGRTIENLGGDSWYESIGDLLFTEGYQIKVSENTSIDVEGTPVQLPMDIDLVAGWNMISFPALTQQNAMDVLHVLMDNGYLLKAMDEKGRSIEELAGMWYNFIGNFEPGKGYKIKVLEACTLTIFESNKSSLVTVPDLLASTRFTSVFSGNGFNHMNVVLTELYETGFRTGDQIGIFDGDVCVGAVTLDDYNYLNNMISIPVSSNDGMTREANGFVAGNTYSLSVLRDSKEQAVEFDVVSGPTQFVVGATSVVAISTELEIDDNERNTNAYGVKLYPNPFTSMMVIEVVQPEGDELEIDIYDIQGRKVRTINYGISTGHDQVRWDGNNQSGDQVQPGLYYIRVNGTYSGNVLKQ